MGDRILDPTSDQNLFGDSELPQDFWERYFTIQKVASLAQWHDGSFTVSITDEKTGKTSKFENVRFTAEEGFRLN